MLGILSTAACEDPIPGDSTGISIPPPSQQVSSVVLPSTTLSISISNMDAPQLTKMERILVARYAPLILPNPLAAMPTGDYLKYMPKFTGEGDFIVEEHLEAFYSYAKNINIEQEDVWTRVFVQSLDGKARFSSNDLLWVYNRCCWWPLFIVSGMSPSRSHSSSMESPRMRYSQETMLEDSSTLKFYDLHMNL